MSRREIGRDLAAAALALTTSSQSMTESLAAIRRDLEQMAQAFSKLSAGYPKASATVDDRTRSFGAEEFPLAMGSLFGVRYWTLPTPWFTTERMVAAELRGVYGSWSPGENRAACNPGMHSPDQVPASGCGCGFWGYWQPTDAPIGMNGGGQVCGVIEGWGRNRRGTKGFRCAKARLVAICVTAWADREDVRTAMEEALTARYGVPAFSTIETMLKRFPTSGEPDPPKPPSKRAAEAHLWNLLQTQAALSAQYAPAQAARPVHQCDFCGKPGGALVMLPDGVGVRHCRGCTSAVMQLYAYLEKRRMVTLACPCGLVTYGQKDSVAPRCACGRPLVVPSGGSFSIASGPVTVAGNGRTPAPLTGEQALAQLEEKKDPTA